MIDVFNNKAADACDSPVLSVLIPYYHDDPAQLLSDLLEQAQAAQNSAGRTEILIYDDGTGNENVNTKLVNIAKKSTAPIRLFFAHNNKGRSSARNYLKSQACAEWVLFLDAVSHATSRSSFP